MKLILGCVLAAFVAAPVAPLKLGEVVPDLTIKTSDGKELKLSDFRANKETKAAGQVVVVFFHSEKCPAAIKPDVVNGWAAEYAKEGSNVKFVALFAYNHDTEEGIKKFCDTNKSPFTWAWDTDRKLRDHFGAKQVNATFVLDREGKLVYRGGCGIKDENLLQDAVKATLGGSKAPESDKKYKG